MPNLVIELIKNIPTEIGELLWVTEGGVSESSAINPHLPVTKPIGGVPDIGYYPAYSKMSPEQRYKYLNWLADISQPIDIGYVFVLLYGLERTVLLKEYEKAFNVIVRLQKHHSHQSFMSYSTAAMLICMLKHNRPDLMECLNLDYLHAKLFLFVRAITFGFFTAQDIIKTHKLFGFTNKRFLDLNASIFEDELKHIFVERFWVDYYPIKDNDLEESKDTHTAMMSNTSLNDEERCMELPDLTTNPRIAQEIPEFLKEANERTKRTISGVSRDKDFQLEEDFSTNPFED